MIVVVGITGGLFSRPGFAEDYVSREQRFIDAVKPLIQTESGRPPGVVAVLMLDPPLATTPTNEGTIAIGFAGVRADALANFRSEVCGPGGPGVEPSCAARRMTITTSQDIPLTQACALLQAALVAACPPAAGTPADLSASD